jgi:Uma2 family endonuclease
MSSAVPIVALSSAEYLRRERLASERSDYLRGRLVAMTGATRWHNRIVVNLSAILQGLLRDGNCHNYATDLRVSIAGGQSYLYPDVVVTCGVEEFEDGQFDTLINPVVIIEVLSPSTEAYDRGEKFLEYQGIASLREYVLVTPRPRRIECYRREADGGWHYEGWAFSPPALHLQSLDVTLEPDEVYFKVESDETSET